MTNPLPERLLELAKRMLVSLCREPFGVGGLVIFVTLVVHYGGARLWTAPIAAVGYVFAILADELWQHFLRARAQSQRGDRQG